ncbi:heterokaryon incompatibility protein-domain-containing protein [Lophiotrema nucula]|uniref:ubiquitinyl hydrolase 1 n=1 Tax=Lophiotrema nucula TaxID=690887 RepID=A0A6A5ZCG6_9PLEO|nr:heterokaryon incompatibility protein-domain-containing protein [Lophiotrema nucula]
MQIRIRGPDGQTSVQIDDTATVAELQSTIAETTGLQAFDLKYGFPPRCLDLEQLDAVDLLCDIDLKLHGEQITAVARQIHDLPLRPAAGSPNNVNFGDQELNLSLPWQRLLQGPGLPSGALEYIGNAAANRMMIMYDEIDEVDEGLQMVHALQRFEQIAGRPFGMPDLSTQDVGSESYEEGSLCGVCRRIDLNQGFFPSHCLEEDAEWTVHNRHFKVGHLRNHQSKCPLCRLMVRAISNEPAFSRAFDAASDDSECSWHFWLHAEAYLGREEDDRTLKRRDLCRLEIYSVAHTTGPTVSICVEQSDERIETGNIGMGRMITQDQVDFYRITNWLSTCRDLHGAPCNCALVGNSVYDKGKLTLRMIDVEQGCIVEVSQDCPFVALSYCWGPSTVNHLKLTTNAIEQMTAPGSLSPDAPNVPTTIADAIILTKNINERFLWVDALCIIQDDPNDVATQIQAMDLIYSSAKLTIVAGTGSDAWAGLPGVRPHSRSLTQTLEKCGDLTLITTLPTLETALQGSHWETRAWTFQEKILSRRILIFARGQMFFYCNTASWSEDIILEPSTHFNTNTKIRRKAGFDSFSKPDLAPERHDFFGAKYRFPVHPLTYLNEPWLPGRKDIALNEPKYQYETLVKELTSRHLTTQADILNAFQGVLNLLRSSFRGQFLWGIPVDFLESVLLWQGVSGGAAGNASALSRFPSWSWASAYAPVSMPLFHRHRRHGGVRSVTIFFQVHPDTPSKVHRLSSDFESCRSPMTRFKIGFMTGTSYTNWKVRHVLSSNNVAFDRALCFYSEVAELRVSLNPKEVARETEANVPQQDEGTASMREYDILDNNDQWLGVIYLPHEWRARQPEKLPFVLIAGEVEGGYYGIPAALLAHIMLFESTNGVSRRVNVPHDIFLRFDDWKALRRELELIILV